MPAKYFNILCLILFLCAANAHAQVRYSYYGDTMNPGIKTMTEYVSTGGIDIKAVYTCDLYKRQQTARFYSGNTFMGKWVVKYDSSYRVIESGLYYGYDTLCQQKTTQYNTQDREVEVRSVCNINDQCNGISDWLSGSISHWITGSLTTVDVYKRAYDNKGRLLEMRTKHVNMRNEDIDSSFSFTRYYYDSSNDHLTQKQEERFRAGHPDTGIQITTYKYDDAGNTTQEKVINITPEAGDYRDTSCRTIRYRYDSRGNKTEEEIVESSNTSWTVDSTKTLFEYDDSNRLTEKTEYFREASYNYYPEESRWRVGGGIKYTYDSMGNVKIYARYWLYRKEDGTETKEAYQTSSSSQTGESRDETEYDTHGNIIKSFVDGFRIRREIEYF